MRRPKNSHFPSNPRQSSNPEGEGNTDCSMQNSSGETRAHVTRGQTPLITGNDVLTLPARHSKGNSGLLWVYRSHSKSLPRLTGTKWLSGDRICLQGSRWGLMPGSGRFPGEGNGNPLQYSCLRNPTDRGAWWATVHGVAELDTTGATQHTCTRHLRHRGNWK